MSMNPQINKNAYSTEYKVLSGIVAKYELCSKVNQSFEKCPNRDTNINQEFIQSKFNNFLFLKTSLSFSVEKAFFILSLFKDMYVFLGLSKF